MTTALVPIQDLERMAIAVAKSNLFGMKTPEQAMSLMLIAQAEGVHPGRAIQEYHVIDGRPALRADAMLARFQAAGGRVEWTEYSDSKVSATFTHPQGGSVQIEWTLEMGKRAGLTTRRNRDGSANMWEKYPRQMLRARVISEGVRTVYPGSSAGIYSAEEVQDMVDVSPKTAEAVELDTAPPPASHVMDEAERADHLAAIDAAADLADLKRAYSTAFAAAKQIGDAQALGDFERAKDRRKVELQEAA